MNLFQSLRFRILLSCLALALVINLLHSHLISMAEEEFSDDIFNWHLANNAAYYYSIYSEHENQLPTTMPFPGFMMVSSEQDLIKRITKHGCTNPTEAMPLPESLSDWQYLRHTDDESHSTVEIHEIVCKYNRYHVAAFPVSNAATFFVAADITSFEPNEDRNDDDIFAEGALMSLVSVISALLLGTYLTRRAVLPLTQLQEDVHQTDITRASHLKSNYYPDEVGDLALHINQLLNRIREFVVREKQFSRDASHELRTPLTSSRMTTELALSLPQGQQPEIYHLLKRIERANNDMTHLIKTFLILGKEDISIEAKTEVKLYNLTKNICHNHNYCLSKDSVEIINGIPVETRLRVQKQLLIIVLSNIIRNAFQHTEKGSIRIYYEDNKYTVTNSNSQEKCPYSKNGINSHGFGIQIVERICAVANWGFSLTHSSGSEYKAELNLKV